MKIDEMTLRAYVDDELAASQREQVETQLAQQPALRAQVQALQASRLPYRSAFESDALPAMPASLRAEVASLTALASSASESESESESESAGSSLFNRFDQLLNRRRWLSLGAATGAGIGLGLAASFAAGPFVSLFPSGAGFGTQESAAWVSAIANYQALYVRATVDQNVDEAARVQRLLTDFAATAQIAVNVPDLTEAGLSFRRIQRLGYENRPLLQMIFLPAQGNPTALCALPAQLADSSLQQSELHGMQVLNWQRRGMAYVLVTALDAQNAKSVALKLMDGAYPTMYRS